MSLKRMEELCMVFMMDIKELKFKCNLIYNHKQYSLRSEIFLNLHSLSDWQTMWM